MPQKTRLDLVVCQRGLAPSRAKAQGMIMAGEVMVDGNMVDKPGARIAEDAEVTIKSKPRFVSRGGDKLAGALEVFDFDPTGRVGADVGASTGGFTDCLLKSGAAKIYAVDVGYGQIDYDLRMDERVTVMERTNARYLEKLTEPVNLVVVDASFISLGILLPVIRGWLSPNADVITLIKPQFEAGKSDVGKGGVVRNPVVHARVLERIASAARSLGFAILGLTRSPIKGPAGNIEFFAWLGWGYDDPNEIDVPARIRDLTAP
jgi:23S rRNA (cytidine1920-2'-O)/16S rRNA (cytidine1409-2'-O)-methyltransferase